MQQRINSMDNAVPQHRSRRAKAALLAAALGLALLGCGTSSQTELPSLAKDERKLLSKDERKQTIGDINKKKDDEVTAARKQIEQTR